MKSKFVFIVPALYFKGMRFDFLNFGITQLYLSPNKFVICEDSSRREEKKEG